MVLKNGHTDSQIAEEMASGLSSRTVEILVRFVYSGKLILNNQDNLQILEELLPASVKVCTRFLCLSQDFHSSKVLEIEINSLKIICLYILVGNISSTEADRCEIQQLCDCSECLSSI